MHGSHTSLSDYCTNNLALYHLCPRCCSDPKVVNRNRMLWRMNRKPAASIKGFEMKDIGASNPNSKAPQPSYDPYFGENEDDDEDDDNTSDTKLNMTKKKAAGGEYVNIEL